MQRRRFIQLLLASVILAACSGREPGLAVIPRGSPVLAFGDSVTYGTGAAPGEDWPALLAANTGWQVENAGVPGDTAAAARERIGPLLEQWRPALVIVELGGNDFLRRRSAGDVKADLRQILRDIKARGALPVLVAVPELSLLAVVAGRPRDAALYRELAEEEKVPLIGDVFSAVLADPALRADQIHPNAQGYRKLADGLLAQLRRLGLAP